MSCMLVYNIPLSTNNFRTLEQTDLTGYESDVKILVSIIVTCANILVQMTVVNFLRLSLPVFGSGLK